MWTACPGGAILNSVRDSPRSNYRSNLTLCHHGPFRPGRLAVLSPFDHRARHRGRHATARPPVRLIEEHEVVLISVPAREAPHALHVCSCGHKCWLELTRTGGVRWRNSNRPTLALTVARAGGDENPRCGDENRTRDLSQPHRRLFSPSGI